MPGSCFSSRRGYGARMHIEMHFSAACSHFACRGLRRQCAWPHDCLRLSAWPHDAGPARHLHACGCNQNQSVHQRHSSGRFHLPGLAPLGRYASLSYPTVASLSYPTVASLSYHPLRARPRFPSLRFVPSAWPSITALRNDLMLRLAPWNQFRIAGWLTPQYRRSR